MGGPSAALAGEAARGAAPDRIPFALQIAVTAPAFAVGGGLADLLGWDALLVAGWSAAVARGLLQMVRRKRRSVAAVSAR